MGPYQNFSYPQMNNYNQPYNPMMNAQQRLAQMEQQYPQFAQPMQFQPQISQHLGLNGAIVDDFGVISANDVPMDGNGAIFIKKDGSEIQLRNWTANGTIQTTSYKPVLEPNFENETNPRQMDFDGLYSDFREFREEITERFDRLEKSMANSSTKVTASKAKKEADPE